MPRQARLDSPGTLHHVMIRGIEGLEIFPNDHDRQDFLDRVSRLREETGARIVAWALMSNHVHILLFSGPQGISRFMRRLLTGYAINYNRRHHRTGHLFQDRYKSIVCDEDAYLLELVRYIHLNPIRAGVVKTLAELDRYRWTGHSVLLGRRKNKWQERDYILKCFSDHEQIAVKGYRKFLKEAKDQGRRPELVGGGLIRSLGGWSRVTSLRGSKDAMKHDARILGGGDFVSQIHSEAEGCLRRQVPANERARVINQLVEEVCKKAGVDEKELRMGGRRRKVSETRAEISYRLNREWGIPAAEIARHMGLCTSAIAKAIEKYESSRR